MKSNIKIAATAVLAIGALGLATGTANAAPAQVAPTPVAPAQSTVISTEVLPGVHYTSDISDHSVVLSTGLGTLTTQGTQFQVTDPQGKTVAGAPFAAKPGAVKATETPGAASIPAVTKAALPLHNVDATDDFNSALGVAATQFGLATGVGTLAGGTIGGIGGCIFGATTGAVVLPEVFLAAGPAG